MNKIPALAKSAPPKAAVAVKMAEVKSLPSAEPMQLMRDPVNLNSITNTLNPLSEIHASGPATQMKSFPTSFNEKQLVQRKSASTWAYQLKTSTVSNDDATMQLASAPENKTGLPDKVKSGVEQLSGLSLSDVNVHYNSAKPAQLQAHAYAQGTDIHVAPGQEKHLPHEAWHVVQQKQGRVQATKQLKGLGVAVNDNAGLEREADTMGAKAVQIAANEFTAPVQNKSINKVSPSEITQLAPFEYSESEKPKESLENLSKKFAGGQPDSKGAKSKGFSYSKDEKPNESFKKVSKNFKKNIEDLDVDDIYSDLVHTSDKAGFDKTEKKVGGDQFVGGRFETNSLGALSEKGFKAPKTNNTIQIPVVFHTTASATALENIENKGIDISFTRSENRFGRGFYVTSDLNTSRSELVHHGYQAYHSLKYSSAGGKILDLTQVKEDDVFTKDFPQGIRNYAIENGFDGVAYQSQRGAGVNFVIYDNFNSILGPHDRAATKVWSEDERSSMKEESKKSHK